MLVCWGTHEAGVGALRDSCLMSSPSTCGTDNALSSDGMLGSPCTPGKSSDSKALGMVEDQESKKRVLVAEVFSRSAWVSTTSGSGCRLLPPTMTVAVTATVADAIIREGWDGRCNLTFGEGCTVVYLFIYISLLIIRFCLPN